MSFYNFRSNPDRQLLQHPLLKGRRMVGRGLMGATFECDEASVYKITCDIAQYRFFNELCDGRFDFFPVLLDAYGKISGDSYLLRCERLTDIRPATGKRPAISIRQAPGVGDFCVRQGIGVEQSDWVGRLMACANEIAARQPRSDVAYLQGWLLEARILRSLAAIDDYTPICEALFYLAEFIEKSGYRLDLKRNNFMLRGQQVVFNDPVTQLFRRELPDANKAYENTLL